MLARRRYQCEPLPSSSPLFEVVRVIDARAQFCALSLASVVPRCGCHSPARVLPPWVSQALLGRPWVMCPCRQVCLEVVTRLRDSGGWRDPKKGRRRRRARLPWGGRMGSDPDRLTYGFLMVFGIGVSHTGGVASLESIVLNNEKDGCTPIGWIGRTSAILRRDRDHALLVYDTRDREVLSTIYHKSGYFVLCNDHWMVAVNERKRCLEIWKIKHGELLEPSVIVPLRADLLEYGSQWKFTSILQSQIPPGAEVSVMYRSTEAWAFEQIDISKCYSEAAFISLPHSVPDFFLPVPISRPEDFLFQCNKLFITYTGLDFHRNLHCATTEEQLFPDAVYVRILDERSVSVERTTNHSVTIYDFSHRSPKALCKIDTHHCARFSCSSGLLLVSPKEHTHNTLHKHPSLLQVTDIFGARPSQPLLQITLNNQLKRQSLTMYPL
ncbi:hypothetical protein Pelo_17005 [Pelomyxa schiedti]|nr:hypothetical protein Pelo_17005 [Pelomyxa schiedti]